MALLSTQLLLTLGICLLLLPRRAAAFGAGNIPSIAQVEGHNWRHGDIEDVLATITFVGGKKWTSMLIKRTYFGNWLRDYSQAVDAGSLKGVNAETIRVLVWILSFLAFGYATEEFEVTSERLGVYRPEEHIDNPLGYADGEDARNYDKRLRGPVRPIETDIDSYTGMKNYIANQQGDWATSAAYLHFSIARSIHYGRLYWCGGRGQSGREDDLCEALRCLGQSLHCLEDFSAHSNYCELALREMGLRDVWPHSGAGTEMHVQGKRIFPLTTGTFGIVDFLHSVIGEANDHFAQSEVDEMNTAMQSAQGITQNAIGIKGVNFDSGATSKSSSLDGAKLFSLLSKVPGCGGDVKEAQSLRDKSIAQEEENARAAANSSQNVDAIKVAGQIYPILLFRDRIVRKISSAISRVPGLEKMLDKVGETLTAFVMGLLAPFVRPIITQVSALLKTGSSGVIDASAKAQFEVWNNPRCSDPTHSILSKDHFTHILNSCAGQVAAAILKHTVPLIVKAWEDTNIPVEGLVDDVLRALHHPALRDNKVKIQRTMFDTVRGWYDEHPRRHELERLLNSESVRTNKNHVLQKGQGKGHGYDHGHGSERSLDEEDSGHGKVQNSLWSQLQTTRDDGDWEGGGRPRPSGGSPRPRPMSGGAFDPSSQPSPQPPTHQFQGYAPTSPPPPQFPGDWEAHQQAAQQFSPPQYPPPGFLSLQQSSYPQYLPPQGPPPDEYAPPPHPPPPGGQGGWGQYPGRDYRGGWEG